MTRPLLALLLATCAAPVLADGLTLKPTRTFDRTLSEGTWMQPDVSPDGRTILFDLLGDIYALDSKGGSARPVLTGMAFETHPVFAPDGRHFAFISDRSGTTNLWIADADGAHPRQLSHEASLNVMTSPSWSPDGRSVYVSRMVHSVLAFEVWNFGLDGGAGVQITKAKPSGDDGWDERHNVLGAVASPDGRYLYYALKIGTTWTEKDLPHWSIARRDLRTGDETVIITGQGAMHPALSHDGRLLAYASRYRQQTGLRLRNLETGEDKWIAFPIDHDGQDQGYYADLTPRFTFAPGDTAIVMSVGGKLRRLDLASGGFTDIPFTAHVQLGLGPLTRVSQRDETGPIHARIIQGPRQSPDGRRLAFSALGTLYVQDLRAGAGAAPHPVAGAPALAYQPSWSPDGKSLAFITWSPEAGGAIWSIAASGGKSKRLTTAPAFYTEPVWSADGRTIAALRASHYDRLRAPSEISPDRPTDIVTLPASGGKETLVAHTAGARSLSFGGDRLRYYGSGGVSSLRLDGSDLRRDLTVVAQSPSQYVGVPIPVDDVRLDASGTHALAQTASELFLVDVPPRNGAAAPVVDLSAPNMRRIKLTKIGADTFDWAGDRITWSLGARACSIAFAAASPDAEAKASCFAADVVLPRDVPKGAIVLRGGTAITMHGDEVIANADVLVVDNRIAAVGPSGTLKLPAGTTIRSVAGKYLLPGFVDVHEHSVELRRVIPELNGPNFLANLAYGVTSNLDPQAFTTDLFVYQDLIDAGLMLGPRTYSVGRGVFRDSGIETKQDAVEVLTRYRDFYHTRNIKSYMVGDRQERQAMIEGAAELGMMPTTEGASDLDLNLTHAIDGFSGNEHAIPVTPLYEDVVQLFAQSRTSYTPTLVVLYGGGASLPVDIVNHRFENDPKYQAFTPAVTITAKLRDRHWMPPEEQTYSRFAADALAIQRAGGLVGLGSHGEVQGLGYHWEMAAYAAGGATPREVLTAATINSAQVIGHDADIGSLEPGKYADILILDADPLADIANTQSIAQVMKNGRIYDAATLDEVWPRTRPLPRQWLKDEAPAAGLPNGLKTPG